MYVFDHCRSGFTDTIAITYPVSNGEVEHIELLTVPRSSVADQADSSRTGHNLAEASSCNYTQSKESVSSVKSWPKIQSISTTLRLPRREAFLGKLSEKYRPKDACLCKDEFDLFISNITVRDVAAKKKKGWFPLLKGVKSKGVSSKQPAKFYLTDLDCVNKNIWGKICDTALTLVPFSFVFGDRHSVIPSLTRTEKSFYSMFAVYFNVMVDSFFHGLSDHTLNFDSEMSGLSLSAFSDYLSWQRSLTLLTSILLVMTLNVVGKKLSKSWKRKVEDPISYWQGLHPIYSCWKTFTSCLKSYPALRQVQPSVDHLAISDINKTDVSVSTMSHRVCIIYIGPSCFGIV